MTGSAFCCVADKPLQSASVHLHWHSGDLAAHYLQHPVVNTFSFKATCAQVTSAEARAAAAEAREAAAEHEDALQALALRTPPLGADRHHRTYWWPLGAAVSETKGFKAKLCMMPHSANRHHHVGGA